MQPLLETVTGIIQRVTFHSAESGWSVLRLQPFNAPETQETVTVHQTQVFAGATMEFQGNWTNPPRFGRQFKAIKAVEKKPASAAALEKYLGSGLIKGVGPKTAKKIVHHFKSDTLSVFDNEIERLTEVPGIASRKLESIRIAWTEHCAIRDVMMFLQGHGISTLFAVRIYKSYGDDAITIHKSQGSEFAVVIIPLLTQHFKMLYRNLIYTGLTRARKLVVIVGSRRALAMAVNQGIHDCGRLHCSSYCEKGSAAVRRASMPAIIWVAKYLDSGMKDINGWKIGSVFGNSAFYNGDWLKRAAKGGIYGNDAVEAMYPMTRTDATGKKLDGSKHNYTLTFPAGQLPPVNAFWSVTMYDGKTQLLIENPINRYLINVSDYSIAAKYVTH